MLTIKLQGDIPAGFTMKLKELAAEHDLVLDDTNSMGDAVTFEFSKDEGPRIFMGEGCETCEG